MICRACGTVGTALLLAGSSHRIWESWPLPSIKDAVAGALAVHFSRLHHTLPCALRHGRFCASTTTLLHLLVVTRA